MIKNARKFVGGEYKNTQREKLELTSPAGASMTTNNGRPSMMHIAADWYHDAASLSLPSHQQTFLFCNLQNPGSYPEDPCRVTLPPEQRLILAHRRRTPTLRQRREFLIQTMSTHRPLHPIPVQTRRVVLSGRHWPAFRCVFWWCQRPSTTVEITFSAVPAAAAGTACLTELFDYWKCLPLETICSLCAWAADNADCPGVRPVCFIRTIFLTFQRFDFIPFDGRVVHACSLHGVVSGAPLVSLQGHCGSVGDGVRVDVGD